MPNGHRSHQSGLDVDVWFLQQPRDRILSQVTLRPSKMPSMIRAEDGVLNGARWSPRYRDALKRAALAPGESIFVNAVIKQALRDSEMDRGWLEKVRPWWGSLMPIPCAAGLPTRFRSVPATEALSARRRLRYRSAQLVADIVQSARVPKPVRKLEPPSADRLPVACSAVLNNPTAWERQQLRRSLVLALFQPQRRRVDAVAQAGRLGAVVEHMAKVRATISAENFSTAHEKAAILGGGNPVRCDRPPETRPAAAGIELGPGIEQDIATAGAAVNAWFVAIVVKTGERALGALAAADGKLLRRQLVRATRPRSC